MIPRRAQQHFHDYLRDIGIQEDQKSCVVESTIQSRSPGTPQVSMMGSLAKGRAALVTARVYSSSPSYSHGGAESLKRSISSIKYSPHVTIGS